MIKIEYDAKKNKAILSGDKFEEIRENFSVKNKAAVFLRRYSRYIPTRTYSITPTGRFDVCLTNEIQKFILEKQYLDQVCIDNKIEEIKTPAISGWKLEKNFTETPVKLKLDLRDYQEEIVKRCLNLGRGTIVLATAGGKTLIMASLISSAKQFNSNLKCLLIVPDRGLVEQTYNDFVEYGVPFSISKWTGDDKLDLSANVIIANLGILQSKNSNTLWLENIDMLVIDEVHKLRKGNEVNKLVNSIKTHYKFGFTGTLPEDKEDQWNIIGKVGPIIYEKNSFDLRLEQFFNNKCLIFFTKKCQREIKAILIPPIFIEKN